MRDGEEGGERWRGGGTGGGWGWKKSAVKSTFLFTCRYHSSDNWRHCLHHQ